MNCVTQGNSFGPFRVYFDFEGTTGKVSEFVTMFRTKDSQYPSLQAEALAVAKRTAEQTYNAPPESVSVTDIEYREDYE